MTADPATVPETFAAPPWRELALALGITLAAAVLAARFDAHEWVFAASRRWEPLQLDELPIALFVFACCTLLLYARRYRQAGRELAARTAAEQALGRALQENRELARRHLLLQEAERKHLARELHDELGQYLNAIKIDAVALAAGPRSDAAAAGERIVACADHVHGAVSGMIRRLRPVGLDELGLGAALEHLVAQWRGRLPDTRITLAIAPGLDALGETLDLAVYRLVQEALTNASRHARAARIEVRIGPTAPRPGRPAGVEVRIGDDGVGMPAGQARGFGLRGMRERVELLGGELAIDTSPGQGVLLRAFLPGEVS